MFLARITAARRADAERRAGEGALDEARTAARDAPAPRDFHAVLAAPGTSLIAEVKRASPSAGAIAPETDPVAQARAYEAGGASAISVLTEPEHFQGSLDDLGAVRASVSLPVLRKDFVCHPLMVWEARAAGADAVLLIVAALDDAELASLHTLVLDAGMTPLVEVHDADEVPRALAVGARIVGINVRNLQTLEVDPAVTARVRPAIPAGILVVAESGIADRADVERVEEAGCDAILVGEALMRTGDPARTIRMLLGRG